MPEDPPPDPFPGPAAGFAGTVTIDRPAAEIPVELAREFDILLRALRANRMPTFAIGPEEETSARQIMLTLLARAGSDRPFRTLSDFAPYLSPLLARSVEERGALARIFERRAPAAPLRGDASIASPPVSTDTEPLVEKKPGPFARFRSWTARHPIILILLLLLPFALWIGKRISQQPHTPLTVAQAVKASSSDPNSPNTPPSPPPVVHPETVPAPRPAAGSPGGVARLIQASELRDGAPTLAELARSLAPNAPQPITAVEYLRRLRDITGLPTETPIAIGPAGALTQLPGGDRMNAPVRIAWAIQQIEQPGSFDTASIATAIDRSFPSDTLGNIGNPAINLALLHQSEWQAQGCDNVRAADAGRASQAADLQRCFAKYAPDASITARAFSIATGWSPPNAPWRSQPPAVGHVASHVAILVAIAVAVFFAPVILHLLDPHRAFLRHRQPRVRPHQSPLLRSLPDAPPGAPDHFREARRLMQRREARPTRVMDIPATIRATIAGGGVVDRPRFGLQRQTPDYLVLIDRHAVNDLEADRLTALIAPLQFGGVGIDTYFYDGDPSWVYPQNGDATLHIRQMRAQFPFHRLLVLTAGEALIDLANGRARGGYAELAHWRRRGLLTPVPRAEWARDELLMAQALGVPVGRATSGGLVSFARRLLADHPDRLVPLDSSGDERAPPLPDSLRTLLDDVSYRSDDDGESEGKSEAARAATILDELSWYLDGPAFEWLCAMAMYPVATFDLALYLGQRLREKADDRTSPPLYTPRRLAMITRLPWVRLGRIPVWLRRAMLESFAPARATEVRAALVTLIQSARADTGRVAGNRSRFGEERNVDPAPDRVLDDEVLLEFLRQGEPEDFEIVIPRERARTLVERFKELDWLLIGTVVIALGYGIAAYCAAPGQSSGPPSRGLWLGAAAVGMGAIVSVMLMRPMTVWRGARAALIRLAPMLLVLGLASIGATLINLPYLSALRIGSIDAPLATDLSLLVLLMLAPAVYRRLGGRELPPRRWFALFTVPLQVLLVLLIVGAAEAVHACVGPAVVAIASLASFVAICWRSRHPFARIESDESRMRRARPAMAGMPLVLALLLLVPGAWLAWRSHADRQIVDSTPDVDRVIGVSAGGLAASTTKNGHAVIVQPIDGRGKAEIWNAAPSDPALPGQGPEENRIVALAVSGASGAIRLAVGMTDGSIQMLPRGGLDNWDPPRSDAKPDAIAAPRLAFASDGSLAFTRVGADGRGWIGIIPPEGGPYQRIDGDWPRVTAIEGIGKDTIVASLADGRIVALVKAAGQTTWQIAGDTVLQTPLPGGARLIRAAGTGFVAIADDGTAVRGDVMNGTLATGPAVAMKELNLGPVVTSWTVIAAEAPPPPVSLVGNPSAKAPRRTIAGRGKRTTPPRAVDLPPGGHVAPVVTGTGGGVEVVPTTTGTPPQQTILSFDDAVSRILQTKGSQYEIPLGAVIHGGAQAAGLTTPERMAAFLAVTAQNTADFTTLTENLNYRSDQLLALFPFSFNAEQAASYAGNPEGIANHLYANKFGNGDEASGDGWRYRGRGLVQIAGRDLYRRAGQPLGIDLVNDPDLLADPTVAARQALNDWQSCKCSAISDSGGITAIWRYVNGSSQVGLSTVKRRYDTYLQQLRAAQTPGSN